MKRFENRYPTPKTDPLVVAFPGEEAEEPTTSKIPAFQIWGPSLVAAVLGVLLTWAAPNLGKLRQHPLISRSLLVGALAAVVALAAPFALRWFRAFLHERSARKADASFIIAKEQELKELLSRFRVFVANHDIRSLRNILRSALSEDRDTLSPILGNEYAEHWAHFLGSQFDVPSRDEQTFSNRAAEFTTIVSLFSRFELQPAQQAISESKQTYSDSFLDALEQLRDEFNAFLRDLEKWSSSLNEHIPPKLGYFAPNQSFQRINPFHRTKAVGITVNGV